MSAHRLNVPFDSGTSRVRITDNATTIGASSDPKYLVLDLDLSAFDQHSKMTNFRGPFMKVMHDVAKESDLGGYGPDNMSLDELIDFGFGEGFVYGTYWDNGRKNVLYVDERDSDKLAKHIESFEKVVVGERNMSLSPGKSGKALSNVTIFKLVDNAGVYDNEILRDLHSVLKVGYLQDGSDLIYLECEASGELTTLLVNSLVNAAMQLHVLRKMNTIKMGNVAGEPLDKANRKALHMRNL